MSSFLPYIFLIVGFVLLVKGADFLVSGASSIARRFNISDLVIGLTVVAFGTSTPELFVNIMASLNGNTGIAIGNVLGSNIANILLILGIASLIYPLHVGRGTVWREIPFSLMAALVLGVAANDHLIDHSGISEISRGDGIIFLMFFVIFMYYSASIATEGEQEAAPEDPKGMVRSSALVVAGLVGLTLGGHWIVDSAVHIARVLGMSESTVGLTIVAIGTSLPELATSAMAAWRRNVEIAVGNVVGSNIFNIFLVLGISSVIKPLPFTPASNFDIGVVILASLILFATMFTGRRRSLDRWEGALMLVGYAVYIGYLVFRG